MSLEIIETGEVIEPMSKVEAERITARIADKLDGIADNLEQVMPMIGKALTRQAWKALGYPSPTAYVSERFSGALGRLPIETRRSVVGELSAAGMSTRAIAPIVGVDQKTVVNDRHRISTEEDSSVDPYRKVISLDGRQRPASQPKPEPESLDEWRGRVLHDATVNGKIVKLTGPNSVANPGPVATGSPAEPTKPRDPKPDPATVNPFTGEVIDNEQLIRQRQEEEHRRLMDRTIADSLTGVIDAIDVFRNGAPAAQIWLEHAYIRESEFIPAEDRLTPDIVQSAIDYLATIKKGITS